MRELAAQQLTDAVRRLCIEANCSLPGDVRRRIEDCRACESWAPARGILDKIIENYRIADEGQVPICQDTGMACVFLDIGQDVHISGDVQKAVDEGVRLGYEEGFLRKSVVRDPLDRVNTGDNTPAMLYVNLVPGEQVTVTVAPKGFGSENMSRIKMFTPAATKEMIMDFVIDTIQQAGANPCPPMVVGVGIGGDFEECALLAKTALCRSSDLRNPDPLYAEMEEELLRRANQTDVGPQGFGGSTTALCVNIETYGTHIAGLPVAVNIGCHVTRHSSFEL